MEDLDIRERLTKIEDSYIIGASDLRRLRDLGLVIIIIKLFFIII